jgi:predicted PurR-regulated permease PerM
MKKYSTDPVIKFFISIIGLVILFIVLKELQHIFVPFIIAYFFVFVFEPLNAFIVKHKTPRSLTIIIDLLIIIGVFWGLSRFIIEAFGRLGTQLPQYEIKLNNIIRETALSFGLNDKVFTEFSISKILTELDYGGIASGLFSSTLSIFSAGFFVLFFFIFVSSGHKQLIETIKRRYVESHIRVDLKKVKRNLESEAGDDAASQLYTQNRIEAVKVERQQYIEKTFKDITEQIQRYIATKFLISLITSIIVAIILYIFDVDFLIVWAALTFFLNFIPNIGSIIAVILPTIMTLIQYESFGYALLVAGIISVFQNLIGNIVEPKIFGDKLGLSPIVILLSLLVWGYVWGIMGMFLSVPLTAVLKIILSNSQSKNLKFISDLMGN